MPGSFEKQSGCHTFNSLTTIKQTTNFRLLIFKKKKKKINKKKNKSKLYLILSTTMHASWFRSLTIWIYGVVL